MINQSFKSWILTFILVFVFCGIIADLMIIPAEAGVLIGNGAQVSLAQEVSANDFSEFLANYKSFAVFISGICTITAIITLVISISKLSVSAENEQLRRKAWMGIVISGVSLALIGGISVIVGIFWNVLR